MFGRTIVIGLIGSNHIDFPIQMPISCMIYAYMLYRYAKCEHTFTVCSCLKYKNTNGHPSLYCHCQAEQGLTNDIFGPYVGDAGFDPAGFVPWWDDTTRGSSLGSPRVRLQAARGQEPAIAAMVPLMALMDVSHVSVACVVAWLLMKYKFVDKEDEMLPWHIYNWIMAIWLSCQVRFPLHC